MANRRVASNSLVFTDQEFTRGNLETNLATVAIFPSSVDTGAAVIRADGPTLLSLDDVRALRDFLTLCIEQAEGGHPFQVI